MPSDLKTCVRVAAGLALALAGSGCDRKPGRDTTARAMPYAASPAAMAAPEREKAWFQAAPRPAPGLHLAYAHEVGLEVSGGALAAHFAAARDRCLTLPDLHCLLLHAEIGAPTPAYPLGRGSEAQERRLQSASLRLRLPHDKIAAYANALTDPLPGEQPGLIRVVRQSTTAEDLGRPVADVAQRVAQLQDYLTSLKALGSRLTISVSDLVKIAGETAQAQSQIETAQAEQRDLSQRVETEALDVDFQERAASVTATDPVDQVMADSNQILRDNVADALRVGIAALPWFPAGLLALIVVWILRRLIFGRPGRAPALPQVAPVMRAGAAPTPAAEREAPLGRERPLD